MLGYIVKFFKALNANSNPSEIANAASIGVMLGLMPKDNALWYILFVFFLFVRINKGFYFIVMILVSQIAWALDPFFDSIGYSVLTLSPFEGLFSTLIEIPFVGFTRFNNTIVTGSFLTGLVLYVPVFILSIFLVKLWRVHIAPTVIRSPILKTVSNLPIIGKIIELAGEKL